MKHLLAFVLILSTCFCKAQNSIFCTQVNCPITISQPQDSVQLLSQTTLIATGDAIASTSWKLVSAPSTTTVTIVNPTSPTPIVRGLSAPGNYVFAITVTTKKGQVSYIDTDSVRVNPAPIRNTIIGGTIKLVNGQLIFFPAYSDGKP